jgi:hypothetical protein
MQCVDYSLPDYPTLKFTSVIQPADQQRLSYEISISAQGPSLDRAGWAYDFEHWCRDHGRIVERKGRHRNRTTRVASAKGTAATVAFIIDWIGLEWLERAMQRGANIQPSDDVSALSAQLQEIASLTHKIDMRTKVTDFRLWAAARATLGLPLPSTDITPSNWDHLLDQKSTNAVQD